MDWNVDHYTIEELFAILEINMDEYEYEYEYGKDELSTKVMDKTNAYIQKYPVSNDFKYPDNRQTRNFFQQMQSTLLQYIEDNENNGLDNELDNVDNGLNKQVKDWFDDEVLPQDDNAVQKNKITDRFQKIDVLKNQHVPMNRYELGVSNTYQVPIAQDKLNPNLENITKRHILLNSRDRQSADTPSTDYTLDLSDPLMNVVSLQLYSIQVPYTWYVIDYIYGNTCFWITNQNNVFLIQVEPGNYLPVDFCVELEKVYNDAGFVKTDGRHIISYNTNNSKVTMNLNNCIDPAGHPIVQGAYFTFFDVTAKKTCYVSGENPCSAETHLINSTLGWLMGYRLPIVPIILDNKGNVGTAVIDLIGTRNLIVVIDDFNQNHINNGLITITELSRTLPLPAYFNYSQPYICVPNAVNGFNTVNGSNVFNETNGFNEAENSITELNNSNSNTMFEKLDNMFLSQKYLQEVLPSAPRTLTQPQIYTINEILKSRQRVTNFRIKAPTCTDTFALIPVKGGFNTGELYAEFSGQMKENRRVYFGPVNIDRMRIKLLDDIGNILNLNGAEWSITICSENLYQY